MAGRGDLLSAASGGALLAAVIRKTHDKMETRKNRTVTHSGGDGGGCFASSCKHSISMSASMSPEIQSEN